MKYHHCQVKHDPENGTFGDCLRACIASILDIDDVHDVPHFFSDGCKAHVGYERLRSWLAVRNLAPFYVAFPAECTLSEVLNIVGGDINQGIRYLLFGRVSENSENHVVVCCGNDIEHDPAWAPERFTLPPTDCDWQIMVLCAI